MNTADRFVAIIERMTERGGANSVYGEPIVTEGRTTVPVAKVAYGFGGGYGSGDRGATIDDAPPDVERSPGEGAGFGGGIAVSPVGIVEITDEGSRFVRFGSRRRILAAAGAGAVAGFLLGRGRRPSS
ncbi:spore germination protein GerW family protein [Halegenticoccus soli]|uniref:spore germination protein GerW family protein n=1 Tax=Halegenticoccus soli TaxID=1985678 RepID=UPI001E506235|nr:spore germination protein GerW family protein [Halegenticoccus soli]